VWIYLQSLQQGWQLTSKPPPAAERGNMDESGKIKVYPDNRLVLPTT
jgi:hypothetical protein